MESVGGAEARPIAMKDILKVVEENPPSVKPSDLVRFEKFQTVGR
jgi:SpoVK/Ycf46/Vps4 family AAA+-type ATPase